MGIHTTFIVHGTEDVHTSRYHSVSRSIALDTFSIAVGGEETTPTDLRAQAATMTQLANAAIGAAHWLEDRAGDLEAEQPQLVGA